MSALDNPYTTHFWTGLVGMLIVTPLLLWNAPAMLDAARAATDAQWLILAAVATLGTGGHLLLILALGMAPTATLMPFIYTQIPIATAISWLVFGQLPDAMAWVGMAVIMACGATRRLAQPARPARAVAPRDAVASGLKRADNCSHVAVLRSPPRQPAAAAAEAGRADPAARRHRRRAHRFQLCAGVPAGRQGRGAGTAPAAPGGRQAPPDAAVPRPERTGQLCAGRQPAVPAAQAGHARALHLHPRGHQGGAAPAEPPVTAHHRPARARPQGDSGAAGDPGPAAARHDADPARRERTDERPAADPRAFPEDAAGRHRRRRLPDAAHHRHRPGKRRRRSWCAPAAATWRGWA